MCIDAPALVLADTHMKHLLLSLVALPAAADFGTLPARRINLNPSARVIFQCASNPRMAPNTRK